MPIMGAELPTSVIASATSSSRIGTARPSLPGEGRTRSAAAAAIGRGNLRRSGRMQQCSKIRGTHRDTASTKHEKEKNSASVPGLSITDMPGRPP